jgi:uncharacterized protein (UPF0276 family)
MAIEGCGIGLRREHYEDVLSGHPPVPWFEVISENFMVAGGRPRRILAQVRRDYPLALHGVSLSIGSAEPVDGDYLGRLADLVQEVEPALVSDHLCWTRLGAHNSHDLLPLPMTRETVELVARRVHHVQERLGRRILLENVSSYVRFAIDEMDEWEFVSEVVARADCELLLDVNNVYVNARNHGFDPLRYLDALPAVRVRQIHLAGHEDHGHVVIDTHDAPVRGEVWELYSAAVERFGPVPTLIERDAQVPPLEELLAEARRAGAMLEGAHAPR